MKKNVTSVIILWLTGVLTAFFIVQKPEFLSILSGLKDLLLIIFIPILMAVLAACMGAHFLPDIDPTKKLTLGAAVGMGIFGLTGFGLVVIGLAKPIIVMMVLFVLTGYFLFTGELALVCKDIQHVAKEIKASINGVPTWIPVFTGSAFGLSLIMGLAPPIEDFDAMLYHLAVPDWWLREGGLTLHNSIGYWVPHIVEGSFVFPMVFGVDTAAHLIHLLWLILTTLLLWDWARRVWDHSIAWDSVAILLTMPSLFWLAGWAYTDFALTFTGIATVYSIWEWRKTKNNKWITTSGIMAGFAMGIKYQSFVIPLTGVLLLILWEQTNLQRLKKLTQFSLVALWIASPWYIRNWVLVGNPFYPFVFGGLFWDSFLAQRVSNAGSGIGFNPGELILLPLTAALGTRDTNYFDGRFGPFYLILFPIAILSYWFSPQKKDEQRWALWAIGLLGMAGILAWTIGVMSTSSLFQGRYLFPSLIPLAIPLAFGLNSLSKFDTPPLRASHIVRAMLAFTVFINLINFMLHVIVRNPLSVALGMTSRQAYMESRQPGYARAVELINGLPENADIYFLFEPRSYGMNIKVQPDGSNENFSHDLWLYKTPEKIMEAWRQQGYTHVLISKDSADFIFKQSSIPRHEEEMAFVQVEKMLDYVDKTQNGAYVLYRIP